MTTKPTFTSWCGTTTVAALMTGLCPGATLPVRAAGNATVQENREEKQREEPPSEQPPPSKDVRVADVVITGTWTPHAQKDSPVEIERITGVTLE